jgi:hypothetical protein
MKNIYARYNVLDKWDSVSMDAVTRRVLDRRMHTLPQRRFFTEDEWRLVEAIAERLIPQPERVMPVPITPWIDAELYENCGEGFRYDDMPPLQIAWRKGLAAIDSEARRRYGQGFAELDAELRDATLKAIQGNDIDPSLWQGMPAQRFFIDILLKSVVGVYYAHPFAWSEIGFGGAASPRGYVRMGFNQRDPWEAKEVG